MEIFENKIYTGVVKHNRFKPKKHHFSYKIYLMMINLDTLDELFTHKLYSLEKMNIASFRRSDYLPDTEGPIKEAVIKTIKDKTNHSFSGTVMMLTHLRYWGLCFNPLTLYYCYKSESELQYIVAEITNTPWQERHSYVIQPNISKKKTQQFNQHTFDKVFHISPFMNMHQQYNWSFSLPGKQVSVYMQNIENNSIIFDATLKLQAKPASHLNMSSILLIYPFMTLKVITGIYFQALRLWLKKIPYVKHPSKKRSDDK